MKNLGRNTVLKGVIFKVASKMDAGEIKMAIYQMKKHKLKDFSTDSGTPMHT